MTEHIAMSSNRLDSFVKMKSEIVDIARTKAAVSRPSPMGIDAVYKGKSKNKGGKGDKGKGKGGKPKEKGKENSPPHDPNVVCYYCNGKGHRKAVCRKRLADLEKAKSEGRPVHALEDAQLAEVVNVNELTSVAPQHRPEKFFMYATDQVPKHANKTIGA